MSHNLEALTPFDFESLAKTVLDEILGESLEIYKPGKDQGIDLRHAWSEDSGQHIVQCKHTPNARIGTLRSHFRNEELPKVIKLGPERYSIFTSAALSKANKSALKEEMRPYVRNESDIYGRADIEHFLEEHPEAVRSHLRLWLSSSSVLRAVLNQDVAIRSSDLISRIERQLPIFVDTPALSKAQNVLQRRRVCLISGPPGIGKTTLAHILCAELIASGYEAVQVTSHISEALKLWQEGKKQVFIFDDFLGRSAKGDTLDTNEDDDIPRFADKVFAASDKCFIMTTRGYILGQARVIYERLSSPTLKLSECLLELEDLDLRSRAMILYNHVWATALDSSEKALFAEERTYWPILRHRNYSPRLVSLSLELYENRLEDADLTAPQIMLRNLDRPMELWNHAITKDLSEESRGILDLLSTLGAKVPFSKLREMWVQCLDTGDVGTAEDRFDGFISVLEGDFLSVEGSADNPLLKTSNPSIDDFMAQRLQNRALLLKKLLQTTTSHRHVEGIQRIFSKRVTPEPAAGADKTWGDSVRPEVYAAYHRLWAEPDVVAPESSLDAKEKFRRLERMWSVAESAAEIDRVLKLTEVTVGEIAATDSSLEWEQLDDLVGLLQQMENFPEAADVYANLFDEVEVMITDDMDTWDSTRNALAQIERLSTPASRALERQISESLECIVRYELATWMNVDDPSELYVSFELEGMLQYAALHSDPEEIFPGFSRASYAAEVASDSRNLDPDNLWSDGQMNGESFDVEGLMKGLR